MKRRFCRRHRLDTGFLASFLAFQPAKSEAPAQPSLSSSLSATVDFYDVDIFSAS
jgi:hypothetical protein